MMLIDLPDTFTDFIKKISIEDIGTYNYHFIVVFLMLIFFIK